MIGVGSESPPRDLVWLRWLYTVFVPLGTYSVVRTWRMPDEWHTGPSFDMLYPLVLLPLVWGACVTAWRGLWRTFVLLAMVERAISAYGALFYFLNMALPSSPFHSLRHPEYLAWNLLCVTLSTAILVHLVRKHALHVEAITSRMAIPIALRLLQGGLFLLAMATTIDLAPTLGRHLTQAGNHDHDCAWLIAECGFVVLLVYASIAGLRNRWRTFVSLALIGQSITAFCNFVELTSGSFREEAYGTAYAPTYLSRNLPVFAFALFSVVYLALRFPPRLSAPAKPSAASAPAPAAD